MTLPNRRNFIETCAAGAGASLVGGLLRADEPVEAKFSLKGRIRKAVKYHMVTGDLSVLDKFKLLKDLGYDGVEPRVPSAKGSSDRKEMLKASEVTDLPIHGVINSSNPDIKSAIDAAKYYGATSVLLVVPANPRGSYLENYKVRQDIVREAVPHAEKLEVQLLIENVWASFLNEPLSMAKFIDELGSPMVGAYFDVGNNIRWGYAEHWIEVLAHRIGKLDIKEYSRKLQNDRGLRAGFDVEIGEGSVDWPRVREELLKIDFQGWATAEVKGGDRARLAEIATRMDQVLEL